LRRSLTGAFLALEIVGACAAQPAPSTSTAPVTSAAPTGGLAGNQVLRLWIGSNDPGTLDPGASPLTSGSLADNTSRGLLDFDSAGKLVPGLATDLPVVSDGGRTLTFTLRDGARYSNGQAIVASDIVNEARRHVDPRVGDSGPAWLMCNITGGPAVIGQNGGCSGPPTPTDDATIDSLLAKLGVVAPDERTVVFHFDVQATWFTSLLAGPLFAPVPPTWTDFTDASQLVSSGPYMVKRWDQGSQIVLVPNPYWYGPKPTLTEVDLQIGGDNESALASYESGDLDEVQLDDMLYTSFRVDPSRPDFVESPNLTVQYYQFATCESSADPCPRDAGTSNERGPTANRDFRIALLQAIDRRELIATGFNGVGVVPTGMVMPGLAGYDPADDPYPFDLGSARRHMTTALQTLGVSDVTELAPMVIGWACGMGGTPMHNQYLVQHWVAAFGFRPEQFDTHCADIATSARLSSGGAYSLNLVRWGADYPNAFDQLSSTFECGSGYHCDRVFDAVLAEAASQPPARATDLYRTAQQLLLDDAAALFMQTGVNEYLVKSYVAGAIPTWQDFTSAGDSHLETIQIRAH
jgi:peptide/nickel transport system substrate-binding protein/oligopeptide transport system substrate-binding protein